MWLVFFCFPSTHEIITVQVKSSAAMEPYCCKSLLINLQEEFNMTPDSLTTDRSTTMRSMIRLDDLLFIDLLINKTLSEFNDDLPDGHPRIAHSFDVWHWIKSVLKDLWEAVKTKACEGLYMTNFFLIFYSTIYYHQCK